MKFLKSNIFAVVHGGDHSPRWPYCNFIRRQKTDLVLRMIVQKLFLVIKFSVVYVRYKMINVASHLKKRALR